MIFSKIKDPKRIRTCNERCARHRCAGIY